MSADTNALPAAFYGDSGIRVLPTHSVIDSTKLSTYSECPRRFFYEYVLGWALEMPNVHLHAGSAIHAAWEHLIWLGARDGGYRAEHVDECFAIFEAEYRKYFNPEDDNLRAPKNPEGVRWALERYIKTYSADNYKPLWTEIAGSVPLADHGQMPIHFKIDAILRDPSDNRIVIMDHKTTSASRMSDRWAAKWSLTTQFFVYTHAALCIFDVEEFKGVIINGIGLSTKPRLKLNGEPYANEVDKQPVFQRPFVRFTPDALEKSYITVHAYYQDLLADMEQLANESPDKPVMHAFRERWTSCGDYGGCPFLPFCLVWSNPLRSADRPPVGFIERHWDPREKEQTAKAVYRFDEAQNVASISPVDYGV